MAGADTRNDETLIERAREAYRAAAEAEHENREAALEDLRFARLGEQWPEKVRRQRELEGRPVLTINRLPAFIRQVVNDARQNRPAITVHPVDSAADPETAEVFNGLIRHIEQSSDAEVAYDTALDFAVSCGFGYFRINTKYANDDDFKQDIAIERVANPFAIYGDPQSTSWDSSDWNEAFELSTIPRETFEARWKGAQPCDFGEKAEWRPTGEDNVTYAAWWTREAVTRTILALSDGQIVEETVYAQQKAMFDALGVSVIGRPRQVASHRVTQRLASGSEILETIPWAGRYIPIVPVYGEELLVDGKRHLRSLVRDARDPQRMFNYWRTTSTELVALAPKAPFIGPKGAFVTDAAKWATANVQSHAFIEFDTTDESGRPIPGVMAPQRQPFAGVPAGALQEALNASDDMKAIMGLHDASLGAKSNETSGRAIMARQREGDISTFHYIDNLSRAIRHAGRILIDLIPKVYSTPRVLRILGPEGDARTVQVNTETPARQQVKGPDGQLREVAAIYDLTAGKYDLTVRAGPSFTSRREEAATQMIELIRAYPDAAPVIGDLLAKNLDWPGADEVAQRLAAMLPPQARGENPELEAAKAEAQKLAEALNQARAEIQAMRADRAINAGKLKVSAYDAETKRLAALAGKDGVGITLEQALPVVVAAILQAQDSPDLLPGGPPDGAPGAAPAPPFNRAA